MNEQQAANALKLAQTLDDILDVEFAMRLWVADLELDYWPHLVGNAFALEEAERLWEEQGPVSCGTARCVAGWAQHVFKRTYPQTQEQLLSDVIDTNIRAFAQFFGIEYEEAYELCMDRFDATKDEKAAQLRSLVHQYGHPIPHR